MIQSLENQLLKNLSESDGDLLNDDDLINLLQSIIQKSKEVNENLEV